MDTKLQSDLLHLVEHARGNNTKELWADIDDLRQGKVWPHAWPEDKEQLQLALFSLQAQGHVVLLAGDGWWLTSQVPQAVARRGFEEVVQGTFL